MVKANLVQAGNNEPIENNVELTGVPRVGEYIMLSDKVLENWKDVFYKVVFVTYLKGGNLIVHIEKYDPEEEVKAYNRILERLINGKEQEISEVEETRESSDSEKK